MDSIELSRWADFVHFTSELGRSRKRWMTTPGGIVPAPILFRGQSNATWRLETTLDRASARPWQVDQYVRFILRCRSEIEAFSQRSFAWSDPASLKDHIAQAYDSFGLARALPYEFMAYLRHHGFPSPLLDWTASPFVAAFFAFRSASRAADRVAIFGLDSAIAGDGGWMNAPLVWPLTPIVRAHPRHFMQQCNYTVCVQRLGPTGPHLLASHEDAIRDLAPETGESWKITLPVDAREEAMQQLRAMNISMYTLFGSEDALVQSIADREFQPVR